MSREVHQLNENMMADLTPEQQAILDTWRATLDGKDGPQADGTIVGDPDDAHSYYRFAGGIPHRQTCAFEDVNNRLVFNPEHNVCDWPQNVSADVNPAPR